MATLSSAGIGSGLDVAGIVQQLVAVERTPEANRITKEQTATTTKISGLATLKGAMSAFQSVLSPLKTVEAFSVRSATTSDDKIFTATATTKAAAGTYDIEVVKLAQAQQLASDPFADGSKTVVGTGTLAVSLGDKTVSVKITETNSSLEGIRDAINSVAGNPGVRATIVQATDGAHLVLSSANTGAANVIKVTSDDAALSKVTYDAAGGNTANYDQRKEALDSEIKIAGFQHKSATNVVKDAIDGVTLTLKEEGETATLTVTQDTAAATARIKNFISQYNAMQGQLASLQSYNPSTGQSGQLLGDALARNVTSEVRRGLADPVSGLEGEYKSLAMLGITTTKDGSLTLDEAKLTEALNKDFNGVGAVFGSENGVAARLAKVIETRLSATGDIATRNASLDKRTKQIAKDTAVLNARMEKLTAQYTTQFSKLDTVLSQLQSTSSYLTQQLANLPQITS
jgi:flagellar hook-associated protein 2